MTKPLSFFDLPENPEGTSHDHLAPLDQHADHGVISADHFAVDPTDALYDRLFHQQDFASVDGGDSEAFLVAGLGNDSGDLEGAPDFAAQLRLAERSDLPGSGKGTGQRAKAKGQGEFVTSDSFEEGQARDAYLVIERYARALLTSNEMPHVKEKAINFFFVPSDDRITFFDCCAAIDPAIRPGVILLRMQYEFWRKWFVFPSPMPEDATALPEMARGPASFAAGPEGVWVAQEAWFQPGLDTASLVARTRIVSPISSDESILETIAKLEQSGVLSHSEPDHWYATGRNPTNLVDGESRKTGGSITWSAMF